MCAIAPQKQKKLWAAGISPQTSLRELKKLPQTSLLVDRGAAGQPLSALIIVPKWTTPQYFPQVGTSYSRFSGIIGVEHFTGWTRVHP